MSCIGTAGHVDHGKSTLVQALTGIDPDRLAEEKERGMTIDLGFAWFHLPGGREVSIVDVPGHESFIKNMLAGVGGIDAALLVVAADEGVMPQTREHLAILDLLRVRRGVVALTKADLVDEEWLALVREEVAEQLAPTTLARAAILPVSAYTGQGLSELVQELDRLLDESEQYTDIARPRLPIDRVFTITGFGTVVTGTLLDGGFAVGQEVEILPQGIRSRVRTLHMHKQQIEQVQPGHRLAINLANVAKHELQRGNVVTLPGQMSSTVLCDARLELLADANRPLLHNMQVDFYNGAQEIPARIRLLDKDEVQPGQRAWIQLRLSQPAVLTRRDRFILRIPSPSLTIGGGEIIDVHPRYHRRFQQGLLTALEQLEQGTPEELILATLDRRALLRKDQRSIVSGKAQPGRTGYEQAEIARQCHLSADVTQQVLETFLKEGRVRKIGALWFALPVWEELKDEAIHLVKIYHQQYPLRSGLSKEEWRTRLNLSPRVVNDILAILQTEKLLEIVPTPETGLNSGQRASTTLAHGLIRLFHFTPGFTATQQNQVQRLLQHFREQPYTPPTRAEAEAEAGAEIVNALIEQRQLIKIGEQTLFLSEAYTQAVNRIIAYIQEHGKITVAQARDLFGASRKYILPLLEHLDALQITRRIGDERVAGLATLRALKDGTLTGPQDTMI